MSQGPGADPEANGSRPYNIGSAQSFIPERRPHDCGKIGYSERGQKVSPNCVVISVIAIDVLLNSWEEDHMEELTANNSDG